MGTLTESRRLRFVTFGALYFAQGVPWGFVGVAYQVFLASHGLSKSDIGSVMASAYLPWGLGKLVAGPIIDRFPSRRFGRRKHFIVIAQLLMGVTLLALPLFDPVRELALINAAIIVHNSFAAFQDVATDGLAVDVLPADERGKANAVMWAAKAGGSAGGGSVGLFLAQRIGWNTLFVSIALLVWAIMLLVIFVRERPAGRATEEAANAKLDLRVLFRSFAFAAPLVGIAIAFITPIGYALVGSVFAAVMRTDLKLSDDTIGALTMLDLPFGVGGALLGGFIADRIGARKAMGLFMVGIGLALAMFAAGRPLWSSMPFLVAYVVIGTTSQHAFSAGGLGFFMTLSNPAVGATQFAVYMLATNLTYSWTAKAGGWMVDNLGIAPTFAVAAAVQVVTIAILPFCNPAVAEARFRGNGGKGLLVGEDAAALGRA